MKVFSLARIRSFVASLAAILVLSLAGLTPVSAQEISPDQLALARKYVDIVNTSNIFRGTMLKVAIETAKSLAAGHPDKIPVINQAVDDVMKSYAGREGELLDQIARVYATVFTAEELTQIVAFYESPVGKKLSQASPVIAGLTDDVRKVYENTLSAEYLAKVRADLKAKGINI